MRITNCTPYVNGTMTANATPRVYVACLAAYNAGHLHGEWVDATDEDEVQDCIERVLRTSPVPGAEEHAFHDYDNFPLEMGEHESVEKVAALGALLEEHGRELVAAVYARGYRDGDAIEEVLTDKRLGVYDSLGDYAEAMNEDKEIPQELRMYVDWERMAEDWLMSGELFAVEIDDRLHLFSTR